jgi:hypothetical protein
VIKGCLRHCFLVSNEKTPIDSPTLQLIQEQERKKTVDAWSQLFPEIVTKEKFINECQ